MTSTPQFLYSWQWIPKEEEGSFSFVDILWITHPSLTLYMKNIIRIKKKLSLENVKIIETNLVGKPETNSPCVFKYSCFSCGQITPHTVFLALPTKILVTVTVFIYSCIKEYRQSDFKDALVESVGEVIKLRASRQPRSRFSIIQSRLTLHYKHAVWLPQWSLLLCSALLKKHADLGVWTVDHCFQCSYSCAYADWQHPEDGVLFSLPK